MLDFALTVEDGEIFVAHIVRCGSKSNKIIRAVEDGEINKPGGQYATVFAGSRVSLDGSPRLAPWATNMASVPPTRSMEFSLYSGTVDDRFDGIA